MGIALNFVIKAVSPTVCHSEERSGEESERDTITLLRAVLG